MVAPFWVDLGYPVQESGYVGGTCLFHCSAMLPMFFSKCLFGPTPAAMLSALTALLLLVGFSLAANHAQTAQPMTAAALVWMYPYLPAGGLGVLDYGTVIFCGYESCDSAAKKAGGGGGGCCSSD